MLELFVAKHGVVVRLKGQGTHLIASVYMQTHTNQSKQRSCHLVCCGCTLRVH